VLVRIQSYDRLAEAQLAVGRLRAEGKGVAVAGSFMSGRSAAGFTL
jgi:hypothetical protein